MRTEKRRYSIGMTETEQSLSEAVVKAIANHEGRQATEISKPLYDVINPDALDTLFRDTEGKVAFVYLGYVVTVDERGNVSLKPVIDQH